MKFRSAAVYSVLRLLAFLVPFGILMIFPIFQEYYWLAAIFAALIGLSLSLLFLRRPLQNVTDDLQARRAARRTDLGDEEIEDAALDAAAASPADTTEVSTEAAPDAPSATTDDR